MTVELWNQVRDEGHKKAQPVPKNSQKQEMPDSVLFSYCLEMSQKGKEKLTWNVSF